MARVEGEWHREVAKIRAVYVPIDDPDYLAYRKLWAEQGAIAAYYWIASRWAEREQRHAAEAAARANAEIIQQIWLSVQGNLPVAA